MKFSVRDLLWSTATIALIVALLVASRQHASRIRSLSERTTEAEKRSNRYMDEAKQAVEDRRRLAAKASEIQDNQRHEILSLRHLLKQSLSDQRKWFELQVQGNRIIAIGPATSESVEVTPRIVDVAERKTGLDGRRLRHFLTPIKQLELAP